jgi:FkbH-like protein
MDISCIDYKKIADELFQNQFCNKSIASYTSSFVDDHSEAEIKNKWLIPLTKLIAFFLQTQSAYARLVYVGERTNRPFSEGVDLVQRKEYFERVVIVDIEILEKHLGYLSPNSTELLRDLHLPLLSNRTHSDVHLNTIGDCLMTQMNTTITNLARSENLDIAVCEHYVGAWGNNNHDNLPFVRENHQLSIIAISLFTYWGHPTHRLLMKQLWEDSISDIDAEALVESLISYIKSLIKKIKESSSAFIFFHNSSGLPWLVEDVCLDYFPWMMAGKGNSSRMEIYTGLINTAIDNLIEAEGNVILIDERAIVASGGRVHLYNDVFSSLSLGDAFFHYNNFGWQVANVYLDKIKKIRSIHKKKVIFVDFDNTLWQGVMAEGSVGHFYEKQNLLAELGRQGVVLVALSKNSPENIRWSEMKICQHDFSCVKINWSSKVNNILEACRSLNISNDQTIILDDTHEELALVNAHLPEILTLDSKDAASWDLLRVMLKVNHKSDARGLNRNRLYRDNQHRQGFLSEASENNLDAHALLSPLAITVTMSVATCAELDRLYELLQRTNQFNCSNNRYSKDLLQKIINSQNALVYCFSVTDKFGDMGLVGAVILSLQPEYWLIENFVMSCRAMGYGLEHLMLAKVLQKKSNHRVAAMLIPNAKNKPAQNLYPSFGFTEKQKYLWYGPSQNNEVMVPSWIKCIDSCSEQTEIANGSLVVATG